MTDVRDQLRAEIERFGIVPVLRELERELMQVAGERIADPIRRERAMFAALSVERAIDILEGKHPSLLAGGLADVPLKFKREGEGR
jgi:hypothetical protein